MKKRTIIIISAVILVLAGVGYWYFTKPKVQEVEQVLIERNEVERTVSASGSMKSSNQANLSFQASGIITSIAVEEGMKVEKGKLLASINTSTQSQSAKAYKDARDIALRDRDLFIEQFADNKDAAGGENEYEIKFRRINEQVSQAEAAYRSQINVLPNYFIYAPFDGTIINSNKKIGETATASETIVTLAELSNLYFEIELDQEDFEFVKLEQAVNITFDAFPDEIFTGKITEVPEYVRLSGTSGVLRIKISVEQNDTNPLLLGMTGDVDIVVAKTEPVDTLIFDEVVEENNNYFVWIIEDGKLKKLPIEIGLEGDIYTEIKTDINNYTIVIPSTSDQELVEGEYAKVITTP